MAEQYTPKDFKSNQEIRWCPGCGDHGIINHVAVQARDLRVDERTIFSDHEVGDEN